MSGWWKLQKQLNKKSLYYCINEKDSVLYPATNTINLFASG